MFESQSQRAGLSPVLLLPTGHIDIGEKSKHQRRLVAHLMASLFDLVEVPGKALPIFELLVDNVPFHELVNGTSPLAVGWLEFRIGENDLRQSRQFR